MSGEIESKGFTMPIEFRRLKDGRQYTKVTMQGDEYMQNVFDGKDSWSTNPATLKPEKANLELTINIALDSNDFPNALFNYSKKGYTLKYVGNETIDGTETYN